ncbi:MAG: beta-glucosidase [Pirellulales bacterium]|nr:beta-glucosidase [Pirellulales bacterium]
MPRFPADFVWGAATSAYQIEGSPDADGAGLSIWDAFARAPGNIAANDNGDVACDHYRRWRDDVALMSDLGLQAYRFSVAWSRVLPAGTGRVNAAGLDFYDRLVDELVARGIAPYVTLYHWDLPAALDARGGWLNPDSAEWFAEYATVVADRLGDRVASWATLNEPWVAAHCGYLVGEHAPGRRSRHDACQAANNLIRAHAAGLAALRSRGVPSAGIVVNLTPQHPASDSPADEHAARLAHSYINRQFLDPILLGSHPEEMATLYGDAWRPLSAADLAAASRPVDFVGVNYYLREVVEADPAATPFGVKVVRQLGRPYSEMGWEIYPDGLREILVWVRDRYGDMPLAITENGVALVDPPVVDGTVADGPRIDYLRAHLAAAAEALATGVDLRGYFLWSLLDNFEWAHGYGKRFGMVHVDPTTGRRTPKTSAWWYRGQIEASASAKARPAAAAFGETP